MAKLKEGDRVRIKTRPVTDEDRSVHKYFEHMQGLVGTVSNYYNKDEIAVTVDIDTLGAIPADVHKHATKRLQDRFDENVSEEVKRLLQKDELNFVPHYVLLIREQDLESI